MICYEGRLMCLLLYCTVVFNLNTVVVYSFCNLAFTYFLCRQKVPKSFALGKNLHKRPLLRPQNVSLRSGACSSLQAFVCFQGAAELAPCGYFEIIYIRITLKHPRTMAWKQTALRWIFQRCNFAVGDELHLYSRGGILSVVCCGFIGAGFVLTLPFVAVFHQQK